MLAIEEIENSFENQLEWWFCPLCGLFFLFLVIGLSIFQSFVFKSVHAKLGLFPHKDGLQRHGIVIFDSYDRQPGIGLFGLKLTIFSNNSLKSLNRII